MAPSPTLPEDYPELLERLKREIRGARSRAALAVRHDTATILRERGLPVPDRLKENHADIRCFPAHRTPTAC